VKKSLIICALLSGCSSIIKETYNVNNNYHFESVADYLEYFNQTNGFKGDKILYPNSISYNKLITQVVNEKTAIYYGTFINDSTELIKSEFLKENISCMGRVLNEIKKNSQSSPFRGAAIDSLLQPDKDFSKLTLYYLADKKPFHIDNTQKKLNVFLLYGKNIGKLFKKNFNEILKYTDDNKDLLTLHFISVDICYNLK
jgi:hypothetical protein